MMDEFPFTDRGDYEAHLGRAVIWIANHPFASFSPRRYINKPVRPSRFTIKAAWKKLQKDSPLKPPSKPEKEWWEENPGGELLKQIEAKFGAEYPTWRE